MKGTIKTMMTKTHKRQLVPRRDRGTTNMHTHYYLQHFENCLSILQTINCVSYSIWLPKRSPELSCLDRGGLNSRGHTVFPHTYLPGNEWTGWRDAACVSKSTHCLLTSPSQSQVSERQHPPLWMVLSSVCHETYIAAGFVSCEHFTRWPHLRRLALVKLV